MNRLELTVKKCTGVGGSSLVLLFLCAMTIAAQAQTPRTAPSPIDPKSKSSSEKPNPPIPIPTGAIKGRVIADDGRVLSNAVVMARAINGTMAMKQSPPDAEGRFTLDDLPAAIYMVMATAPGYIDESMTIAEPEQWPRYLIGSQVRVRLVKGSVITGLVTNSKGQPVVKLPVGAVPIQGSVVFGRNYGGPGLSETDDRGIYRIYGLPPGQYIVEAGGGRQFGRFSSTGFDLDVPIYYPSSTRDTAVPVTIRAGEEATGIDIRYRAIPGHSVSGTIITKSGVVSSPNHISVMLSHAGTANFAGTTIAGTTEQGRSFSFEGVADGEYDVFAVFMTSLTENATAGSKRVTVRGGDVTGVELSLTPLGSIAGSIKLDPIAPEAKCDKRGSQSIEIALQFPRDDLKKRESKSPVLMMNPFGSTLSFNGDFSVRNLEAGTFRLGVKLPTDAWYVRAINLPSPQATQPPRTDPVLSATSDRTHGSAPKFWPGTFAIKAGENLSGVSILVGQDAASLRGNVSTTPAGSAIIPGLRVHLLPIEREEVANFLRYYEAAVESNGGFAFTHIAPGRYFLFPRVETLPTTEIPSRPIALDTAARAKLRRDAETLNEVIELTPCQRKVDVTLKQP